MGAVEFDEWARVRVDALLRFAYLSTGDVDRARTLAHRALVAARRDWERLSTGADPDADVRRLLLAAAMPRRRVLAARAAAGAPIVAPGEPEAATAAGPGDRDLDLDRLLWDALDALELPARAALVLRFDEARPQAELPWILGTGADTADELVVTALRDLSGAVPDLGPAGAQDRLPFVLAEYASRAPMPAGLVDAATRDASRDRRRRRLLTGAVLAALVVPVAAWGLLTPDRITEPADTFTDSRVDDALARELQHWRWESYGGIQVQVPADWGYGDLTQWCAPPGEPGAITGPVVDRPGTGPTRLCSANGDGRPTYTAGLLLRPVADSPRLGRADVATGATIRRAQVGAVMLTVVDTDEATARHILGSASDIYGTDVQGCPAYADVPSAAGYGPDRPGTTADPIRPWDVTSISICRYGITGWQVPTLLSSERLQGRAAHWYASVLERLPDRDGDRSERGSGEACRAAEATQLLIHDAHGRGRSGWVFYSGCGPHGVGLGDRPIRGLTPAVLRPILDPPFRGRLSPPVWRLQQQARALTWGSNNGSR